MKTESQGWVGKRNSFHKFSIQNSGVSFSNNVTWRHAGVPDRKFVKIDSFSGKALTSGLLGIDHSECMPLLLFVILNAYCIRDLVDRLSDKVQFISHSFYLNLSHFESTSMQVRACGVWRKCHHSKTVISISIPAVALLLSSGLSNYSVNRAASFQPTSFWT